MFDNKIGFIKFIVWGLILILFSAWVGNFWLALGLPILFDIYVSKKIRWNFWKNRKDGKKPHYIIEWIDAIVFALIAVGLINNYLFQNYKIPTSSLEKTLLVNDHLFVSKVAYGPRNLMTPLAFPLAQNRLPIVNTKSYFEKPQWAYKRLKGFGQVKRNDIVVFNFPAGDTVPVKVTNPDFYALCRMYGRDNVINNKISGIDFGEVEYRPVDRRDNYVKRCVAIPGDTIEVRSNWVYINGEPQKKYPGIQFDHYVRTGDALINPKIFEKMNIAKADQQLIRGGYYLPLTFENTEKIEQLPNVQEVIRDEMKKGVTSRDDAFPHDKARFPWNRDNFGPLWIPKAGVTVPLTINNLPLYKRIIEAYERNTLAVKDSTILINGEIANSYTFKMDYYFMMGDNRHRSADSRYWGFVPEDHVVGKPILVWLSLDKDKSFPANIRWDRFFKIIHNEDGAY